MANWNWFFSPSEILGDSNEYTQHTTYNYCVENWKDILKLSLFASLPSVMIKPQWLEPPIIFYGPKDVWAIEIQL